MTASKHIPSPQSKMRPCTCHPDDNPPVPCAERYALTDCKAASLIDRLRGVSALQKPDSHDGFDVSIALETVEVLKGLCAEAADALSPQEHLRVKPLVWREDRTAKALGAKWMVWPYSDPMKDGLGQWLWQVVDAAPHASGRFHTEEGAKAAAEADYERRILSMIEIPSPSPTAPAGWKLVPIEPTEDMSRAWNVSAKNDQSYFSRLFYADMLAAAPPAPHEQNKGQ